MIFHCLVVQMRIGNFADRKMRNHYNRRTRFAWLLMMVYLPMLLAAGCIAGTVIGLLGGILTKRLEKFVKNLH